MTNEEDIEDGRKKTAAGPSGIGGWLMLLIAGLIFLGPLLGAGRINADFLSSESEYPNLVFDPRWIALKRASWGTFLLICATSIYGGWGLARGYGWEMVTRAKYAIWLAGPVGSFVLGVFVPGFTFGLWATNAQFVGGFIGSVLAATIWTAYLSKSKRVRNTYGAPPETPTEKGASAMPVKGATSAMNSPKMRITPDVKRPMSSSPEEECWAAALAEYESDARRPGLYAKSYAEAEGSESAAKANYLRVRAAELRNESEADIVVKSRS